MELFRRQMLKLLPKWEQTFHRLHPYRRSVPGEIDCGCFEKHIHWERCMSTLNGLECHEAVFDIEDYEKKLDVRLGSTSHVAIMMNRLGC